MFMRTNRECQKSQQHISKCLWGSKFISEWSRQYGGFGLWYWLNVQEEKLQEPMWPMQWPSSSKVARVNLKQKMTGGKNGRRTRLLNLLLKQLSGIPLRDTVVNGTRQSDFERFFGNSCFSSFVLPSASVEELSLYIFPSPSSAYMAAL